MWDPRPKFSQTRQVTYYLMVLAIFQLVGFTLRALAETLLALLLSYNLAPFGIGYRPWQAILNIARPSVQVVALLIGLVVALHWWRQLTRLSPDAPPYRPPIRYV